jgi:predicted transcriptional regulator
MTTTHDSHYAVLKALDGAGRLAVHEIVPEANVVRSCAYSVLAECEKNGFVTYDTYKRPRTKKNGKRTGGIETKRYSLTPKGRKFLLEAEAVVTDEN